MRSFCFFQIRISRQTFSERHTTHTDTLVGCTLRVSLAFLLVFIVVVTDSWPTVIFFDFFLKKKKTRVDYQKTTRSVTCELELQFSFFFCVERWGFLFFFCCLGCHFLRFSVRFFCFCFFFKLQIWKHLEQSIRVGQCNRQKVQTQSTVFVSVKEISISKDTPHPPPRPLTRPPHVLCATEPTSLIGCPRVAAGSNAYLSLHWTSFVVLYPLPTIFRLFFE